MKNQALAFEPQKDFILRGLLAKKVGVSTVAKEKGKTAGGEGTPPSPRSICHTIYRTKAWASRTETIIAFCQRKTDGARRVAHLCSPAPQSYAQWGVGTESKS